MKAGLTDLLRPLIIYLILLILLVIFWRQQWLLTGLLIGLFWLARKLWRKGTYDDYVYGVSIVVAFFVETISVYHGAWTYSRPNVINIPSYIPFAYGVGIVAAFKIATTFYNPGVKLINPMKEILIELGTLVLLVIFMSKFWSNDWLLTGLIIGLFVIVDRLWSRLSFDYLMFALAWVMAPIVDLTNIPLGVWWYGTKPFFMTIPLWLPFGYALGILTVVKLAVAVRELKGI